MSAMYDTPGELLEAMAALRFPPRTEARLRHLMDQNNEGLLTEQEREELESLVELNQELSLVRAGALRVLGRRPT
jgi:hypothetical protein